MDEKQSTRDAWRRRQALTRRHGGRGRGQPGQPRPPGRRGQRGRRGHGAQPAGAGHVVPDQRSRYQEEDGMDGVQGSREDYADWLSTSAKDSRELLRRQRVALPDVHEFTRFVLEARHAGSNEEEDFASVDESLDLGAIGACLSRLPIEVMLAVQGSEALERDMVRRIEAGDAFVAGDLDDVVGEERSTEEMRGENAATSGPSERAPAADLAAELDAFLGLEDRGGAAGAIDGVEAVDDGIGASTLEDDLAWFDQL